MRFAYLIAFLCMTSGPAIAQGAADYLPGPKWQPQTAVSPAQPSSVPACTKSYCKDMRTCAEAYHHFSACGMANLDRDNDGIPCEDACGKTIGAMQARINAEPYSGGGTALGLMSAPQKVEFSCDGKRTCKQMLTCAEATFYLQQCGVSSLDGDRDGLPCNGLCK